VSNYLFFARVSPQKLIGLPFREAKPEVLSLKFNHFAYPPHLTTHLTSDCLSILEIWNFKSQLLPEQTHSSALTQSIHEPLLLST
jgi:hypothetical protein